MGWKERIMSKKVEYRCDYCGGLIDEHLTEYNREYIGSELVTVNFSSGQTVRRDIEMPIGVLHYHAKCSEDLINFTKNYKKDPTHKE